MLEQSDEELVRAFQHGDETAFTGFVARHQDRVYRMAMIWLRDQSLASDVLQETLMRGYTGLTRFAFRSSPATWLLRVCRNVCHEENRRSARVQPLADDHDAVWEGDSQAAQGSDQLRRLLQEVEKLPERQREVVMLRMFEELSVKETARVMRCRPGTVKAHLNKALNALRNRMQGQEALLDDFA